jgi:glycosyltransferase involved in cell wall biosynthesis
MKVSFSRRSQQLGDDQTKTKLIGKPRASSGAVMPCERETTVAHSQSMPPLVSVVIPTYNCADYLGDAVESVFRQTYSRVECIVIDDGSTDQTSHILTKLSTRFPSLKTAKKRNGGLSSARNLGLRLCSGDFVSFLDADDVLLPDKIERQVGFLDIHPDVGLVYSDYLIVSENLQPLAAFVAELPRELDPLDAFCYRNWFNSLVTLIRRSLIDKVGDFDEDLVVAEDWDYWIRCAKIAPICYLDGTVALYRQHHSQLHRDHLRMRQACVQVATKSFHENRSRLRAAMAAIELTDARYFWKQRKRLASLVALLKFGLRHRLGLHGPRMLRQLQAIAHSQFKPLRSTE